VAVISGVVQAERVVVGEVEGSESSGARRGELELQGTECSAWIDATKTIDQIGQRRGKEERRKEEKKKEGRGRRRTRKSDFNKRVLQSGAAGV